MPFHQVGGITVYSECAGTGPRLLFISGSGGDLRRYRTFLEGPLVEHFEMLQYDQRGLGQTSRPNHEYTMADYAHDAAGLLDAYGWGSCHVMGVSFGGMVAQEFALRNPQRVRRLVLACSSSGGSGGSSYPLQEYLGLPPEEAARRSLPVMDTRRGAEWQDAHPDEARAAMALSLAAANARRADPEADRGYRRQLAARAAHDTYDRLPQLSMPVLVAGGKYDGQAPPANQERLRDRIPNARLEFFEGGHMFLQQDPRALQVVIAFLEEP